MKRSGPPGRSTGFAEIYSSKVERMKAENDSFQVRNLLFVGADFQVNHVNLQGCMFFLFSNKLRGSNLRQMNGRFVVWFAGQNI